MNYFHDSTLNQPEVVNVLSNLCIYFILFKLKSLAFGNIDRICTCSI
jgi:hypothetical protein